MRVGVRKPVSQSDTSSPESSLESLAGGLTTSFNRVQTPARKRSSMLHKLFANAAALASVAWVLFPSAALAQSGITGLVKDASGGILPGVTVEATSPALIEQARIVVTGTQGGFRVTRP